jgi:pimeloyl-ACP methyl ester carboxylesterase
MARIHAASLVVVFTIITAACTSKHSFSSPPRVSFREGSGRPVVMIGGGVYGAAMFAPHARHLSRSYDVIRVQTLNVQQADLGGAMPPDYTISAEATAVHHTLLSLGLAGPVDVVGSSFGAVVALRLTTLYPGRVRSLVLFEPPAFWVLSADEFASDPELREMRDLSSRMSGAAVPSDEELYRFRCILGTCPAAIPRPTDSDRQSWDRSRLAMRGLAAVAAHHETLEAIHKLHVPVLLINGADTVRFHRRINEVLSNLLPNVRVAEIPGSHGASRTSEAEFLAITRAFLADVD